MDKRLIGFFVIAFGILVLWHGYISPKIWPPKPMPPAASRPADVRTETAPVAPPVTNAPKPAVPEGERKTFVLENAKVKLVLSNVGAVVEDVYLKEHHPRAGDKDPMPLLRHYRDAARALELRYLADPASGLESRAWSAVVDEAANSITFKVVQPDRWEVTKVVTLARDASVADVALGFRWIGNGDRVADQLFRLVVSGGVSIDGDFHASGDLTGASSAVFSKNAEGSPKFVRVLPAEAAKSASRNAEGQGIVKVPFNGDAASPKFVADVNPYFGVYAGFESFPDRMEASVAGLVDPDARGRAVGIAVRSRAEAEFRVAASKSEPTVHKMFLYFGPNEPAVMTKELGAKADAWGGVLSKVHSEDLGFFGVFARAILAILNLFHGLTQSWGWSIVLLTITVRLVLFPINRKSQISMLRHSEVMARIKPEIDKLREKYSNDPRALMAEQSKLMKANGVGMMPIGGCLPLFLQLPVFYGLFSGLRSELALRQASFLWAKDLSQPDHLVTFSTPVTNPLVSLGSCCLPPGSSETISGLHLLPILMMVAWFLNSWLQPRPTVTSPEAETQRKMMMFMPVLFGVMMYGYAAGLSLYWLVSSLVGSIESKVIKRSIAAAQPAAVAAKSTRG